MEKICRRSPACETFGAAAACPMLVESVPGRYIASVPGSPARKAQPIDTALKCTQLGRPSSDSGARNAEPIRRPFLRLGPC